MKKERKVWAMTLIAFWSLAPNQTKRKVIRVWEGFLVSNRANSFPNAGISLNL
jgi:hypothetical protein